MPPSCRRFSSDGPAHGGAETRGFGAIFCQAAGERTNELAISIAPKHLEARQAALAETLAIVLNGALLR
jgi:hypothetical protein